MLRQSIPQPLHSRSKLLEKFFEINSGQELPKNNKISRIIHNKTLGRDGLARVKLSACLLT